MNLRVISFLIQHRDTLSRIAAAVQKFDANGSYVEKWSVVDEVARILLPLLEAEQVKASWLVDDEDDGDIVSASFLMGAEAAAAGVDCRALVEVILPILIAILKALATNE